MRLPSMTESEMEFSMEEGVRQGCGRVQTPSESREARLGSHGIFYHPDGSPILSAAHMSRAQRQAAYEAMYEAMCAIADAMNAEAERRGELRAAVQGVIRAFDIVS